MRVAIVGGSYGIGNIIVKKFSAIDYSRSTGFDISSEKDRHEIIRKSIDYDVFINHAWSGDHSQYTLLYDIIKCWKKFNKDGYIINTGSINTHFKNYDNLTSNLSIKTALDELCKMSFKQFQSKKINFKVTNLKLGLLDTEINRNKKEWKGRGITEIEYYNLITYLLNTPVDFLIGEMVIETRNEL